MKLHIPHFVGYMFIFYDPHDFRWSPVHITKVSSNSYSWSNGFGEGERGFASYTDCEKSAITAITESFAKLYERIQKGEVK